MLVKSIKTRKFKKNESLFSFIVENTESCIRENTIIAITSKIVSLSTGSTKSSRFKKETLVKNEADYFLGEIGYGCYLTIKNGLLIPSAGIDESNSEDGDYILYPKDPYKLAHDLLLALKKYLGLKNLGLIFTDSHTQPLRKGVLGTCLAYAGFKGVESMVGLKDLYQRELTMTFVNKADALAVAATLLMGEGGESCPLALVHSPGVVFVEEAVNPKEILIDMKDDLYWPIYKDLI